MSNSRDEGLSIDYPLAEVLGTSDLIHQARPVGRFGSRIETRCGLQGNKTGRDGGIWCPECKARQVAKTATQDDNHSRDEEAAKPCGWCDCEGCDDCGHANNHVCGCRSQDEDDRAADDRVAAIQAHVNDAVRRAVAEHHTWRGLMALLDEHYPADVQLGDPADPGPRILALTREVNRLREQLAAENARAEREREPEADLLHATGPTSIVLGVIRARHKSAGRGGWASRGRSFVIAGFDDPADRQFALHAHDDIAGLLGIVERAHRDLRIMYEEHRGLRARLNALGEATEWGEARTEWTWGARRPDGSAAPLLEPDYARAEEVVRREFAAVVENMGYRKVLLHRLVPGWREAPDAAADGHSLVHETEQENHG